MAASCGGEGVEGAHLTALGMVGKLLGHLNGLGAVLSGQNRSWSISNLTPDEFERMFKQSVQEFGEVFEQTTPTSPSSVITAARLSSCTVRRDQLIMTQGTIDYYKRVMTQMGGRDKTMQFGF